MEDFIGSFMAKLLEEDFSLGKHVDDPKQFRKKGDFTFDSFWVKSMNTYPLILSIKLASMRDMEI